MPGICMSRMARSKGAPAATAERRSERGLPALGAGRAHAPVGELLAEDGAVRLVVVHDQHPVPGQATPAGALATEPAGRRLGSKRAVKQNVLPAPGWLFTPMVPPISGDELAGDREAEAGAAVAPGRGAVGLGEGLEEPRLRLGGDADAGVADLEAHGQRALRPPPPPG